MDKTEFVLDMIREERERQDEKWGIQHHDNGFWSLILQEEIGEAAQALLQGDTRSAVQELVQAAAVIVAWIENTPDYVCPFCGGMMYPAASNEPQLWTICYECGAMERVRR